MDNEGNAKHSTVFDTDRQYLGDVYGKALLGLGQKDGSLDQLVEQLDAFVQLLDEMPKLRATLESPRIGFAEKEKILDKVLEGRSAKSFANFIKVVASKGRMDCLSAIRSSVHRMADDMAGRVKATMTTAEAVDDTTRDNVARELSKVLGKEVKVESRIDPAIIGGLVIRVGDTVYDGSISNQLNQVRSATIERANQEIREALDRFAVDA